MKRIQELIACVRNRYPNDEFFSDFEESCRINDDKKKFYQGYNNALMMLDEDSWQILKEKALGHFLNHREDNTKGGLFNILNEAFAYCYFMNNGYRNVKFIRETGKGKVSDIEFVVNNKTRYCEVKTSNISKDEVHRKSIDFTIINPYDAYSELTEAFFNNKFPNIINKARTQLNDINDIIFIIIIFDDFTLEFIETYRRQLIGFLKKNEYKNLIIQIGLDSEEYLQKKLWLEDYSF